MAGLQPVGLPPVGGHWTTGACTPKVIIKNECFPAPHERYNCTTCKRALLLPYTDHPDEYAAKCSWDGELHIGYKFGDKTLECKYDPKPRPRKGYTPEEDEALHPR